MGMWHASVENLHLDHRGETSKRLIVFPGNPPWYGRISLSNHFYRTALMSHICCFWWHLLTCTVNLSIHPSIHPSIYQLFKDWRARHDFHAGSAERDALCRTGGTLLGWMIARSQNWRSVVVVVASTVAVVAVVALISPCVFVHVLVPRSVLALYFVHSSVSERLGDTHDRRRCSTSQLQLHFKQPILW